MQTSTQLTINQKAVSVTKYSWAKEMFLELDKLPEFSRKCLNNVMTKLYDYFNQDDANS